MFRFFVAFLVSAKSTITPDFRLDLITSFGSYEWALYWRHHGRIMTLLGWWDIHMHYNDSLKGDNMHKSFEPHSKVFQNSHFALSSII